MDETAKHPMTERQVTVLRWIAGYIRDRGYPPSIREIGVHFDLRAQRSVVRYFDLYERRGLITREFKMSRTLVLTDAGWQAAGFRPPQVYYVVERRDGEDVLVEWKPR